MNKCKRFLALLLVLCMAVGLVPFSVFAAENAEAEVVEAQTVEEAQSGAQLLALLQKPADGTTKDAPFAKGTGGSQNFRIPGIVTLDSGRLVASCDARWNHTGDGAGLDTIVSWSDDNGTNWHYTFANYLGDNGNEKNVYSTSFIDPAVATDGQTVYMIADLFPAGIALNTSKHAPVADKNGLDDQGRLLLRENTLSVKKNNYATMAANASYDFYLENGKIYQKDGTVVDGYTVDAYFNITGSDVNTNLFCADSPYQPYPTNYLYMTTSADGQNWSAPQLLNLKEKNEQTLLVGPGNGVHDAKRGNMIFTAYEHTSGTERTSLIWMDAKGGWHRSADANFVSDKSSEASGVVLSDGTVRVFYRNMSNDLDYTDFTWNGSEYVPGNTGSVAGASKTQNNQLSAIVYSKKANGQDLILVSTAVGSGTFRVDGHIYAISVGENNSMTLLKSYDVVSGSGDRYDYSCLTEMNNGDIAMLYENQVDNGEIAYKTVAIRDIVGQDVQLGDAVTPEPKPEPQPENKKERVQLVVGESADARVLPSVQEDLSGTSSVMENGKEIATYEVTSTQGTGTDAVKSGLLGQQVTAVTSGDSYIIVTNGYALTCDASGKLGSVKLAVGEKVPENAKWTVTGDDSNGYTIKHGSYTLGYKQTEKKTVVPRFGHVSSDFSYTLTTGNTGFTKFKIDTNGMFFQNVKTYWGGLTGDKLGNVQIDSQKQQARVDATNIIHPITVDKPGTPGGWTHTVRFTGVNAGTGIVTIGDVTYDLTVKNQQKEVHLTIGQEVKFPCNGEIVTAPNNKIATAVKSGSELVITGKSEGTTKVIAGGVEYTVHVSKVPVNPTVDETPFVSGTGEVQGKAVTKLTVSQNLPFDLNLKPGMTGTNWRIEDPSIAEVDQNGVVTGKQPGATRVFVTVNGVEHSIPVVISETSAGGDDKKFDFYISEITDTTVYYILNNDYVLHQAIEGEAIYLSYPKTSDHCINFFGAPEEGYALTRMSATNALGHYFLLHNGDNSTINTTETGFVNGKVGGAQGAGVNQQGIWGSTPGSQLYNSVQAAINAKCDGGMGWTRKGSDGQSNAVSDLTFRSEKLPSVDKKVLGVLGTDGTSYREYVPGMTAQVGEKVYYQITVNKYASQDQINYTNVMVEDVLNDKQPADLEVFKGDGQGRPGEKLSNPFDITTEITADGLNEGSHKYFASYKITENDLDTTLVNKADLTYNYKSSYSSGAFDASASAEAEITATKFAAKDIVVDFGLPVTVHYDAWGAKGQLVSGVAKYGTVAVSGDRNKGWDVTYTPNKILQGVDTVTLYGQIGEAKAIAKYQFRVYPATTVFYEEGFAALSDFVSGGSANAGKQEAQLVGAEGENYGYTGSYTAEGMTNGTEAVSDALNQTASLTFTGTGVDLYANCDENTGVVLIRIKNAETGKIAKFYQVDTRVKPGITDATQQNENLIAFSLPIVSVRDLPAASYTVELRHVNRSAEGLGGNIRLDGYRVYGTLALNDAAYPASEQNPQYTELRDALLSAIGVDETTGGKNAIDQVHTAAGSTAGVVVIGAQGQYTKAKMDDLLKNGPKNELFIYPNQVVTFTLDQAAQLGMKAINGKVDFKVNGEAKSISTAADMFYDVPTGNVTIKNISDNILSLTLVKHFGDSTKVFGEISEEQMTYALRTLYAPAPSAKVEAALTVSLVDYSGKELASVVLSAQGAAGEQHTFTAEEIRQAARAQMGQSYALVDRDAIADTAVAYGESGSVSVQVGQTATLHVNYYKRERKGFFGPVREVKVGSADMILVQTDQKNKAKFSASEIRTHAPESYRASFLTISQRVAFGSEKSVKVIVH